MQYKYITNTVKVFSCNDRALKYLDDATALLVEASRLKGLRGLLKCGRYSYY